MGETKVSALNTQCGGDHYKDRAIQPIEYIHANGLPFIEGSIVKYITRWRDKGGVQDLEKIKHYVDLLIELEGEKKPLKFPWRQWVGESHESPVAVDQMIEARLKNGIVLEIYAGNFRWKQLGNDEDIEAWRVAK